MDPVVQDRTNAPKPIQDVPERKVVKGRLPQSLVRVEKHLWGVPSGMDGQKVAEECDCSLAGFDGNVGPVDDAGQMVVFEQNIAGVVVVMTNDGGQSFGLF